MEKENRKIIFLDVDGVLNSKRYDLERTEKDGNIDPGRLPLLRTIVEQTGAELVFSSSWREHWSSNEAERDKHGEEIDRLFRKHGMMLSDKTPVLGERADEIKAWLEAHPEVGAFVILDDILFGWGELSEHLVRTDANIGRGLEDRHVKEAIRILNRE